MLNSDERAVALMMAKMAQALSDSCENPDDLVVGLLICPKVGAGNALVVSSGSAQDFADAAQRVATNQTGTGYAKADGFFIDPEQAGGHA